MTKTGLGILVAAALAHPLAAQTEPINLSDVICSRCEIVLDPVVTMGESDGMGMLELTYHNVTTDSRGRYYVSGVGPPHFWVFDHTGQIVQRVGRGGQGPGEFRTVTGILVDSADSLFVFDAVQGRFSVLSPDYELLRTAYTDASSGARGFFLGESFLVNLGIRTPDRVGQPLHIVGRDGKVQSSFGSLTDGVYRPDMRAIIEMRAIARASDTDLWVGRLNQYVIERWDTDGSLIQVLERDVDWFPTWWRPESTATTPPVPLITALNVQGDTLWVLVAVPGLQWQSGVQPRGRLYTVTDFDVYKHTMVEAIDLRTLSIIASSRVEKRLDGFVGPGLVFGTDADALGNPVVSIERLRIDHPRQGGKQ